MYLLENNFVFISETFLRGLGSNIKKIWLYENIDEMLPNFEHMYNTT